MAIFTITNAYTETVRWGNKAITEGESYVINSSDVLMGIGITRDAQDALDTSDTIKLGYLTITEDGRELDTQGALAFLGECYRSANLTGLNYYSSLLFQESVVPTPALSSANITDFVVLGASIMNETFGNQAANVASAFISQGVSAPITHELATGGWTLQTVLNNIDTLITTEMKAKASTTLVMIHIGGNDVSNSGGFPNNAESMVSTYRRIILKLQGYGFRVAPASISYRIPPASNPSDPFNEFLIEKVFNRLTPEWVDSNNRPVVDVYSQTFGNQDWHEGDGIHMNPTGEAGLMQYIVGRVSDNLKGNVSATNIAPQTSNAAFSIEYQESRQVALGGVVADAGVIDWTTLEIVQPSNGVVTNNTGSLITIDYSGSNFSGTESFSYRVADAEGLVSDFATVTMTIAAEIVPDAAPVTAGKVLNFDYQESRLIGMEDVISDVNGDVDWNSINIIDDGGADITVDGPSRALFIDYSTSFLSGVAQFITFNVQDGRGATSNTSTIVVNISEDVAPAIPPSVSNTSQTVVNDNQLNLDLTPFVTAGDAELDWNSVQFSTPAGGGVASVPSGTTALISYFGTGFNGVDVLTYSIADVNGERSAAGTITMTVTVPAVSNAAPVVAEPIDVFSFQSNNVIDARTFITDVNGTGDIDWATLTVSDTSGIDPDIYVGLSRDPSAEEYEMEFDFSSSSYDGDLQVTVSVDDMAGATGSGIYSIQVQPLIGASYAAPAENTLVAATNGTTTLDLTPYWSAGSFPINFDQMVIFSQPTAGGVTASDSAQTGAIDITGTGQFSGSTTLRVAVLDVNGNQSDNFTVQVLMDTPVEAGNFTEVVFNVGTSNSEFFNNNLTTDGFKDGFIDVEETPVDGGITVSGSNGKTGGSGRGGTDGPSSTTMSLQHNSLPQTFFFLENGDLITFLPDDTLIESTGTYKVSTMSSRNTSSTDRFADITVDGVTQSVDASVDPTEVTEWFDVSGADLIANGITVSMAVGSAFGYINGLSFLRTA